MIRPSAHSRALATAAVVLGFALALGGCASAPPEPAPAPEPAAVETATTPPPATTAGDPASSPILLPVAGDPTVSMAVWFDVGSADDPAGKEGLASITGTLVAEGATAERSYEQILEDLYPLAAAYSVRVDKEMTTLSGRTHVDNLDLFVDLFTDAFLAPAFRQEDFERVRSNHLNYLEKTLRYASDEELGKAALHHYVFSGTSYAHPVQGTVAGVRSITLDDVRDFYRRYYTRSNAVVALGGGYTPELVARLEAARAELPAGEPPPTPAPRPRELDGREVLIVSKPDADSSISFGFPITVQRGDEDFYALWLANSWLGEHRNSASHLYGVIRETRGLNYGDYSYIEAYPEGGQRQMPPPNVGRSQQLFEVWIRTLPDEHGVFALRAALRELERLVEEGMSQEEFELSQRFLSKYYLHFAETTGGRLGFAIDDRFYGIAEPGHLQRFGEEIRQLTREEVNAAIRRHLQLDDVAIAIVTGSADTLRETLIADTPTPITYPTPKPDEVMAEDVEIARVPLSVAAEDVHVVPVEEIFER